jgi:hypothetical protein
MQLPPACSMRARAVAVKRRAAMWRAGTSSRRLSSVTVATTQMVLSAYAFLADSVVTLLAIREIDIGGRLMRDMKRRRRTTLLKFESVRPALVSGFCRVFGRELCHTGEEAVELHQKLKVDIVALGRLTMAAPNVVTIEVDT